MWNNLSSIILLLATLATAAIGAGCEEDNGPTPCDKLGELESVCIGGSAEDSAWLCQAAIDGDEAAGDPVYIQCLLDCAPETCDELDNCDC